MTYFKVISTPKDTHIVYQMPWLLEDYQQFHNEVFDWGMDHLPTHLMSFDLPPRLGCKNQKIHNFLSKILTA